MISNHNDITGVDKIKVQQELWYVLDYELWIIRVVPALHKMWKASEQNTGDLLTS